MQLRNRCKSKFCTQVVVLFVINGVIEVYNTCINTRTTAFMREIPVGDQQYYTDDEQIAKVIWSRHDVIDDPVCKVSALSFLLLLKKLKAGSPNLRQHHVWQLWTLLVMIISLRRLDMQANLIDISHIRVQAGAQLGILFDRHTAAACK